MIFKYSKLFTSEFSQKPDMIGKLKLISIRSFAKNAYLKKLSENISLYNQINIFGKKLTFY